MKSYILAVFGFLISWPITLSETTFDQTYEIIDDITEESESDSSISIEDEDLSYDWLDEDEDEENMNYDGSNLQDEDEDDSSIEDEDLSYDWSDKDEDEENLNFDWSSVLRETLDDYDDWTMSPENATRESQEKVKISNSYKAVTKSNKGEKKFNLCIFDENGLVHIMGE